MKYSNRTKATLWSAAMAVSFGGIAAQAIGQTTNSNYTVNANLDDEIENAGPYGTGTGYVELYGPTAQYGGSFSVIQYSTGGGTIPNSVVTAVSPNFTVDLTDEGYPGEDTSPQTFKFYLTDDNTSNLSGSGTPASPLIYENSGTVGPGLATPGSTGSFAAGSNLYYVGSGIFTPNASANPFNLSLTNATQDSAGSQNISAAESYLLQQVKAGGDLRLVVTTTSTDTSYLSYLGYTSASPPQLTLNVTSTTAAPNNSTISLTNTSTYSIGTTPTPTTLSMPAGTTANNIPGPVGLNLGRVIESYPSFTSTLAVGNSSATGSALVLTNPNGLDASLAPTGASNPIPASGTGNIVVGFSSSDTNGYTAGLTATGSVVFEDADNTSSTITVNASAYIVDQRKITAGGTGDSPSPAAINANKILVGSTGHTAPITLATTNTNANLPLGNDEGPDVLTSETLAAGATSSPYTVEDPFSKVSVATISATSTGAFVFNSATADTNGVTGNVAVAVSGVYGDDHQEVINTQTEYFSGNYTSFSSAFGLTNDGTTAGESDFADVYLQWQGYQLAAVTSGTTSGSIGSTNTATTTASLTNAASNDNIFDGVNNGLRANADVTGITFNDPSDWSQSGFSTSTVIIAGGASVSDTISFPTTNKLNGVYGATMTVGLQNEQDIQGAAANDLPAAVISLQATITSNTNTTGTPEAGTYTFGGGTLVAPATNLTGSFTQTGGASSFVSIAGTGSVNVSGGTATIIGGPGGPALIASSLAITGSGKVALSSNASQGSQSANPPSTAPTSNVKINSLSISGAGTLDIGNNHLIINYGSGADPIGSIAAWIADGAYGSGTVVTWTGTGITSSAAASNPNYGIGYADANDAGNPAGLAAGQIEVMYTLLGDANLDGKVNGTDFNLMATNFNQSVTAGWDKGDFNYDGKVNGNDFVLLAANFNQFASQSAVSSADITALDNFAAANGISLASVPEPAIASLMFVAGFGVLRRRRRASR